MAGEPCGKAYNNYLTTRRVEKKHENWGPSWYTKKDTDKVGGSMHFCEPRETGSQKAVWRVGVGGVRLGTALHSSQCEWEGRKTFERKRRGGGGGG